MSVYTMTTTQKGQKHHYIPCFYLRQWTGNDGRLCEFSRPYDEVKPRRTYPDGTGYVRGLNTFPTFPTAYANALEEIFLKRTDNDATLALRELAQGRVNLTADQRSGWSRFIMTLIYRNPEAIDRLMQDIFKQYPASVERALATLPEEIREKTTPEEMNRIRAGLSPEQLEMTLFQLMQDVMNSHNVGNVLNSMSLGVIEFDDTHPLLLTSDRPIWMSNGFRDSDAFLILPISPHHIATLAKSRQINDRIMHMARYDGLVIRINNKWQDKQENTCMRLTIVF